MTTPYIWRSSEVETRRGTFVALITWAMSSWPHRMVDLLSPTRPTSLLSNSSRCRRRSHDWTLSSRSRGEGYLGELDGGEDCLADADGEAGSISVVSIRSEEDSTSSCYTTVSSYCAITCSRGEPRHQRGWAFWHSATLRLVHFVFKYLTIFYDTFLCYFHFELTYFMVHLQL